MQKSEVITCWRSISVLPTSRLNFVGNFLG